MHPVHFNFLLIEKHYINVILEPPKFGIGNVASQVTAVSPAPSQKSTAAVPKGTHSSNALTRMPVTISHTTHTTQ